MSFHFVAGTLLAGASCEKRHDLKDGAKMTVFDESAGQILRAV